jgi:probable rRNA maturation factor
LALFAGKAQRAIKLRGEVVILITNSRHLRELNRKYRQKDQPTDVLSFPAENPKLAGDISISAEIATANAAELGHSTETELRILILHGLLHLAGYDHETDRGEMRELETRLWQQFRLPTGLIERAHGVKPGPERVASRTRALNQRRGRRTQDTATMRDVKGIVHSQRNGGGKHR